MFEERSLRSTSLLRNSQFNLLISSLGISQRDAEQDCADIGLAGYYIRRE
jgi:hypothetical protein